jgi:hypothetical protein
LGQRAQIVTAWKNDFEKVFKRFGAAYILQPQFL